MNSPQNQFGEQVQAALREAARVTPLSTREKARLRARLLSARPQPRAGRLVLAFGLSLAVGVLVTSLLVPRPAPISSASVAPSTSPQTLVAGAFVEASPLARIELLAPDRLRLLSGRITVTNSTAPSLTLLTPMFDVVLQRQSTAVASTESAELVLREGSALVTREHRQVTLQGPATITSSDSRLQPPAPAAPVTRSLLRFAPPADPACGRTCVLEASRGSDVSAQLALTRLAFDALQKGTNEEAQQLAQSGLTRFPAGVLVPENHLVLMQALAALGQAEAAQREGRWFLEHAATAPAAPKVALFLGDLALQAHDAAGALRLYQLALQHEPSVDDTVDALEAMGSCELELGHHTQARAHFQRALDTLPSGPRAATLRARLENFGE